MLLEMVWWDWSDEQLRDAMSLLTSADIEGLHAHWRARIEEQGAS